MRKSGKICADTLSYLVPLCQPGITGLQIDKWAEEFINDHGATASCKNYKGFPANLCLSVNSGAVHNIPNNEPFKLGDCLKLDLVVDYNGLKTDSAITVLLEPVKPEVRMLSETTYKAMLAGVEAAKEGQKVLDISKAIFGARNGLSVIAEFCGHGVGRNIHESPQISNIPRDKDTSLLVSSMVVAIEPIFCLGDPNIYYKEGTWPTYTLDGNFVAHWEHSVLITKDRPEILTLRRDEQWQLLKI